jgi:hypothetical protein
VTAYLSRQWIDAARRRVETQADLAAVVGPISMSLLLVVTDRPALDGEAIFIRFENGRLTDVTHGPRTTMETKHGDADFTIWGSYETFSEIHSGRLTEKLAVLSGRVRLKGSMFRALRLLKVVEPLNALLRQEPARY